MKNGSIVDSEMTSQTIPTKSVHGPKLGRRNELKKRTGKEKEKGTGREKEGAGEIS